MTNTTNRPEPDQLLQAFPSGSLWKYTEIQIYTLELTANLMIYFKNRFGIILKLNIYKLNYDVMQVWINAFYQVIKLV